MGGSLAGARLLLLEDPVLTTRDEPRIAFEAAVGRLAAAGARLAHGTVPAVASALALAPCLASEAYGMWRTEIEARPDVVFAPIRDRFRAGAGFSAPDFVAACRELERNRAAWLDATAGYDAVLLPTVANLPPNAARLLAEPDYLMAENLLALRNTSIASLLGLCALTLPTGTPSCGLMAVAPPREEARLLRLGAAMERALA